jgi:biopolymer transport protein ExbD/biopolymer transport protein TolR
MAAAIQASSNAPLNKRKRFDAAPEINVTPLVDVVLVLLIIFMVIAPTLEQGERVEVPGVVQPDKEPKGKLDPITVTVARSGTVYLEKAPTTTEALVAQLQTIHSQTPDRRVVLKGDGLVEYQKIRDVFSLVQSTGFGGVALQVQARGEAQKAPSGPDNEEK